MVNGRTLNIDYNKYEKMVLKGIIDDNLCYLSAKKLKTYYGIPSSVGGRVLKRLMKKGFLMKRKPDGTVSSYDVVLEKIGKKSGFEGEK